MAVVKYHDRCRHSMFRTVGSLQKRSSPNFPNRIPNFAPKHLRTFRISFPGKRTPLRIHQNPDVFQCQIPRRKRRTSFSRGHGVRGFELTLRFGGALHVSSSIRPCLAWAVIVPCAQLAVSSSEVQERQCSSTNNPSAWGTG